MVHPTKGEHEAIASSCAQGVLRLRSPNSGLQRDAKRFND